MANKVLLQLEAAEKVVVADMRIALLLAQNKANEVKKKAEADYKAAVDDVQVKGQALSAKLQEFVNTAKIVNKDIQFDTEKYYYYVKTEVTEKVEDAVKAVDAAITAEIKKGEAVIGEVVDAVKKAL
jgi:hypothetical protein